MIKRKDIDNFDFTLDTPNFWDSYWLDDEILGHSSVDPDCKSKTLQIYQKLLYSKPLPNGEILDLKVGSGVNYLTWKNFRFGSDSIIASFRYKNNRKFIETVSNAIPNYKEFIENYIHNSYTIGGEIIFPKRMGGINQTRGCNTQIKDRFDLTLECIRKYYVNEKSPLYDVLLQDREFFDLFVDFKGYVEFFYLQDCVSDDFTKVKFWLGEGLISENPLPKTVDEYLHFIEQELEFVKKRNLRIKNDLN